ncbi:DNA/RNA non-specific endonuclease [Thiomicrorhabdus sediminis]|uniref:DNA/RNA non-specific endonuclease n=1 Tax=Thiomicrorhabdus sediminis TaxID=2580412 RepID=A0A4P9K3A9_9GAMM|nr:DNA/RNA non-specific endonuclease [Thiomicrorhabdus sediminis]QCU89191.1 DNA/RNA non-specific endonuclease [Thiomicrorhabdus sediminis]
MKTNRSLINAVIQLLFKHPKILFALPVIAVIWFGYENLIARPGMAFMGVPQITQAHRDKGLSHILRNDGFMLEYSEGLRNPLWVTYQVTQANYKSGKRPRQFSSDWRSLQSISHQDYTGSGFDRGHMAPNYLIASRYGRNAQLDTFLMTNISPQKANLNQKSWQRLEELVANDFHDWFGDFWVVTGPIFSATPKTLKNSSVRIPDAFYKILIKPGQQAENPQVLAFIFPQNAGANDSLMKFVSTIDEIEKRTGLDFFHQLDDNIEALIEAEKSPQKWRLSEVAKRPNRY